MARKKKPEEHENHERWLISYADFITLLFAFFVVMYSISSVNEGKYRVVSNSLVTAFGTPVRSLQPIQVGELARAKPTSVDHFARLPSGLNREPPIELPVEVNESKGEDSGGGQSEGEKLEQMADEIEASLEKFIEDGLVEIREADSGVEVEVTSHVLFSSGSSALNESALPLLTDVAEVLRESDNEIQVKGYTDSIPIMTYLYPSNWELSAARAATVVRLFSELEVAPERMVSLGYGEHHPVATNETPEGRARNRRVVIVVMAKPTITQGSPEVDEEVKDEDSPTTVAGASDLIPEPAR